MSRCSSLVRMSVGTAKMVKSIFLSFLTESLKTNQHSQQIPSESSVEIESVSEHRLILSEAFCHRLNHRLFFCRPPLPIRVPKKYESITYYETKTRKLTASNKSISLASGKSTSRKRIKHFWLILRNDSSTSPFSPHIKSVK